MTKLQKQTAQAIVNIFEAGSSHGDYAKVTLLKGDSGHLTYGRSQTTLASGNLHLLIKDYSSSSTASFRDELKPYLERLAERDLKLDDDAELHRLLRLAGGDPVMHKIQDKFFDRVYWKPSVQSAASVGVVSGLGVSVVYDSRVHGSWGRMRDRTNQKHGMPPTIGEREWISHYVDVRRDWLASHSNELLQRTVYRMDAFRTLIADTNWDLALPITIRGVLLNEEVLAGPALRVSAEEKPDRVLVLREPRMKGDDVKALQRALNEVGASLKVDGVYGPATEKAVRQFQRNKRLRVDGAAGPATRAKLGL